MDGNYLFSAYERRHDVVEKVGNVGLSSEEKRVRHGQERACRTVKITRKRRAVDAYVFRGKRPYAFCARIIAARKKAVFVSVLGVKLCQSVGLTDLAPAYARYLLAAQRHSIKGYSHSDSLPFSLLVKLCIHNNARADLRPPYEYILA